ncbi:MAG: methyltransferase domain-containing protein [Candidatus Latescibacteria bacterium]|nr:methyltransferase domain-containing protein [Candidatus Latescibacterota bacterium]
MSQESGEEPLALSSYRGCAEQYSQVNETNPFRLQYERPALLGLLPETNGKGVLDAGCGSGWLCEYLLAQGAKVTGVDITPAMVEMAQRRLGPRATVVEADLGKPLDFIRDASLDLVVSSLSLHYLRDWRAVFAEFGRILVERGRLVFSVYHPFNPQAFGKQTEYFTTERIDMRWSSGFDPPVEVPVYRRPLTEMLRPLRETGYLIEQIVEPVPTDECERDHPELARRMRQCPLFLCVRAVKIGA